MGAMPRTNPVELETGSHPLRDSPGFLLGKADQHGAELAERALEPLELKARHFGALVSLQAGPLSQQELGQLLRIDRTTMMAVVDHLEQLGFVVRSPDPADRRAYQVRMTAAGEAGLEQAGSAIVDADNALVGRLSARERTHLVTLLRKLCGFGMTEVGTL
jgi:DNA-binding MarR family transcriptional regulator